jgi:hypothetical protein
LSESVAIAVAREVTGGTVFCVTMGTSTSGDWKNSKTWAGALRKLVDAGADPPAAEVMSSGINELRGERGAKASDAREEAHDRP